MSSNKVYYHKGINYSILQKTDGTFESFTSDAFIAAANTFYDCIRITESRIDRTLPDSLNFGPILIPTTSKREHEKLLKEDNIDSQIESNTATTSLAKGDSMDPLFDQFDLTID